MEDFYNEIFDSIKIIINEELNKKLLPLSIEGVIVDKNKNKNYIVKYNDVNIEAYPIAMEYNIGDHVIVLLADGRINGENKYILGKTDYRESIEQGLNKTIQEQINDLQEDIDNISFDNKITTDEKAILNENWNSIIANYNELLKNMDKFELDKTDLEQAYQIYYDFVFNNILNNLQEDTELSQEQKQEWNDLSKKYFEEFSKQTEKVNELLNKIIYNVQINSNTNTQVKENTNFIFTFTLWKNGIIEEYDNEISDLSVNWYVDDILKETKDSLSLNYILQDKSIKIELKILDKLGEILATNLIYITSYKDGVDGLQGPQGLPGKSSYTHIAYADSETGEGFSQNPDNKVYIGIYTDNNQDDSNNPQDYEWSLIKGAQGPQGIPGKDGNFTHFAYMNTIDNSDNSFTTSISVQEEVNNFVYLGQYTDKNESDSNNWQNYIWTKIKGEQGQKGDQGVQGPKGDNGESSYTHIAYSNSADGSLDFSTNIYQNKQYMGVLVDRNVQDSTNYQDYQWSKIKGEQGIKGDQGVPGKNGIDGRTTYFHTAFANSSDGSVDFSTTNYENKEYLGQYTDFVEADSTNYRDYQWTKIKGEQGPKGDTPDIYSITIEGESVFKNNDTSEKIFNAIAYKNNEKINLTSQIQCLWSLNKEEITPQSTVISYSLSNGQTVEVGQNGSYIKIDKKDFNNIAELNAKLILL